MGAYTTKTFRSGNSEAVRLPRELGFGVDVEVEITRHGDTVSVRPKSSRTMQDLVDALRKLPRPPSIQEREPIEWPERPGL